MKKNPVHPRKALPMFTDCKIKLSSFPKKKSNILFLDIRQRDREAERARESKRDRQIGRKKQKRKRRKKTDKCLMLDPT